MTSQAPKEAAFSHEREIAAARPSDSRSNLTRRDLLTRGGVLLGASVFGNALTRRVGADTRPPVTNESSPDRAVWRALVMGDWGAGNSRQRAVAAAMSRLAVSESAAGRGFDAIITTGDNFYDNGVSGPDDPQWTTKFEAMYDPVALDVPCFAVLGNHDWRGDPVAQIAYGAARPGTRWRMDGFFYRRAWGRDDQNDSRPLVEAFFLDSNLWLERFGVPGLGERQSSWLERALSEPRARWRVIVLHHPPFTDGQYADSAESRRVRELLVPLCASGGVDLVLCGHDHDLQRIHRADHRAAYLVSGAAGASLRPRKTTDVATFYRDMTPGFATVEFASTSLATRFFDAQGDELDFWMRAD